MTLSKYEQVVEAFRELTSACETPTQDKIKAIIFEKTGVKMSNSTVSKHLQTLRTSAPDEFLKVAQSDDEPIPSDLMPAVTSAVNHIRRTVELLYNKGQLEQLEAENSRLESKLEEYELIKAKLEGKSGLAEELFAQIRELTLENEALKQGIAPDQIPVVEALKAQLEAIAQERDEFADEVEQLKKEMAESASSTAVLENRIKSLDSERKTLVDQCHQLKIDNAELDTLRNLLKEKEATIAYLEKQQPKRGIAPLEVDAPSDSQLNQQLSVALAEIERLKTQLGEKERQEYLESLEAGEGASASALVRVEPTHPWAVGDTFKSRSELKSHFKLSERESRKSEVQASDGSKWRQLSDKESKEMAKRLGERSNTIFYKCVG
jgi:DNA repair exonuclease SbcCD ATPase subunit